jgi:hypothetical protein
MTRKEPGVTMEMMQYHFVIPVATGILPLAIEHRGSRLQ